MRDIGSSSSLSQQQIKRSNLTSIVNYVMTHDRATKRDICDETNLSWGLVSKVVNQYLHMGLFEEKGLASREGKGRTGAIIGIPDSASWSLGVSIRPNVIRTKVITLQGKLVEETVHAVTEKTQAGLLLSLFNALDKAFQKAPLSDLSGPGCGGPCHRVQCSAPRAGTPREKRGGCLL